MRTHRFGILQAFRSAARIAIALVALASPMAVVQAIEASPSGIIGEEITRTSGAGLVLLVSLQRG
jgi:hypothetical protein